MTTKRLPRFLAVAGTAALLAAAGSYAFDFKKAIRKIDAEKVLEAAREVHEAVDISPEKELEIGREVASNLIAKYGLVEDRTINRYVSLVGETLVRYTKREDIKYRFGVLDSDFLGAYALPGGFVLITRGFLDRMGNEAQLAGVLAHEISHVDRAHAMKAMRKKKVLALTGRAASSGMREKRIFNKAAGFLIDFAEGGFSRADEFDADAGALPLAAAAGYDGSGLYWALGKFYRKAAGDASKGGDCGRWYRATHPPLGERRSRLKTMSGHQAKGAILQKRYQKYVRAR